MTPEGIEQNAVVYDLMTDMFWRRQAPDLDRWLSDYAHRRYGKLPPQADRAWKLLRQTVYNRPRGSTSVPFSLPCDAPSLGVGGDVYYNPIKLARAWQLLGECGDELGDVPTYRYDLVDVGRQVLSNLAGPLQTKVASAYAAKDLAAYRAAVREFLELIDDMDQLVSTQQTMLLGKWLDDAKSLAADDRDRALFEWNARTQITLWGPPNGILRDYAVKEWGGMLHGFYGQRWRRFFKAVEDSLVAGRSFDGAKFDRDLRAWEDRWTHQTDIYPHAATGDAVAISRKLLQKYFPVIEKAYQYEENLTTGKPVTVSGGTQDGHPPEMAVDGLADRSSRLVGRAGAPVAPGRSPRGRAASVPCRSSPTGTAAATTSTLSSCRSTARRGPAWLTCAATPIRPPRRATATQSRRPPPVMSASTSSATAPTRPCIWPRSASIRPSRREGNRQNRNFSTKKWYRI